jgi:fibronectin-binding autotransporter adhesin
LLSLLAIQPSQAASATWKLDPATSDWNTSTNWTPVTVPNGPSDVATFATSNQTAVSLSASTEVNNITYNGTSAFTTTVGDGVILTFSGSGILNHSGALKIQNFVGGGAEAGSYINFLNGATAGQNGPTNFTLNFNDFIVFRDHSTAGTGTFTLNGNGPVEIDFYDTSSSGTGTTFILNGTADYAPIVQFFGSSSGGGTLTLNGNGQGTYCVANESSSVGGVFTINGAENSTNGPGFFLINSTGGGNPLIANAGLEGGRGGVIYFAGDSTSSIYTQVKVFGNGTGDLTNGYLDISGHTAPGLEVGSIEGSGAVFLGANKLTVGGNDLSAEFSGMIQGTGGSLAKTGKGQLTLSTANTYTGGTTVSEGTLLVTNRAGSATGTGTVTVERGTLAGTGRISGAVTIGTTTRAAILAPGNGTRPRTLTIRSTLTFNSPATYQIEFNSNNVTTDRVVAKGMTINSSALVSIDDLGGSVLPPDTVFTVISNTAATPIAGTFSNLADGSTLTVDSNTYLVSYEGGDGNDLTLTVQ